MYNAPGNEVGNRVLRPDFGLSIGVPYDYLEEGGINTNSNLDVINLHWDQT